MDASETTDNAQGEFQKAVALLNELVGMDDIRSELEKDECRAAQQVYSRLPVLSLLILQRLSGGLSLSQVVSQLLKEHRDLLPDCKRVRTGTLSENNSAYGNARSKLPLEIVAGFSHRICDHLASQAPEVFASRRVFIIDGTTITLPPTPNLVAAFPPAENPRSPSVWPVALLTIASELSTGCVLVPQVDPMYGDRRSSETQQCRTVIEQLPRDAIVLADSGYGIFAVAWKCIEQRKDFLFRLTKQRFKAYVRKATLIEETQCASTWHYRWKPSYKDRQSTSALPAEAELEVFIHRVAIGDDQEMYLVTSLEVDAGTAGTLYRRRYDVEFDIRDFKVTMDTENLRGQSVDTMLKELCGSVIAFNLVMQFRRQAAELAAVEPRRLSFSGVWLSFQDHLIRQPEIRSYQQWLEIFAGALVSASKRKLPNRSKPRSFPRRAHGRAAKSTKFQKAERSKPKLPPGLPDP